MRNKILNFPFRHGQTAANAMLGRQVCAGKSCLKLARHAAAPRQILLNNYLGFHFIYLNFRLNHRIDWHLALHHFKGHGEAITSRAGTVQMIPADVRTHRDGKFFRQVVRIKDRPILLD